MDWESIWKTAVAIIGSIGGAGAIICAVVKFSSDRIAERLSAKYQLELNKELEQYKSLLSKKNYVSKTRFDTEFAVCKELMMSCESMIDSIHALFPNIQLVKAYGSGNMWTAHHQEQWSNSADTVKAFSNKLEGYAPFISKGIYDEFRTVLSICKKNVYHYLCFNPNDPLYIDVSKEQKTEMLTKAFEDSLRLSDMLSTIAGRIRQYFQNMDIQE